MNKLAAFRYRLVVSLLLACATGHHLFAQAPTRRSITGTVADSSGNLLPHVNISVGPRRTTSSDSGRFTLAGLGPGPLTMLVLRIGHEALEVRLPAGSDTTVRLIMRPVAVQLSAVSVTAQRTSAKLELRGFYDRMRDVERGINRGYFITPEDIERRNPPHITHLLENYPSIRTTPGNALYARILGVGGCAMTVYLDNIRIVGGLNRDVDELVNTIVRPNQIAGVEIYPRATGAPPQFQALNGSCGVVVIWTK